MNLEFLIVPAVIATAAQTGLGMLWFGKIFGKQWMKFMEFSKLSAAEKAEANKNMPKLYGGQLFVSLLGNLMLGAMLMNFSDVSPYVVVLVLWLGFVFTSQSTSTIWSQTKFKYVPAQIMIATGNQLVAMLMSAFIFTIFS